MLVFVTATVLSSIVFHLLTQGQDIQATGISAVGYAFVTGGVLILPNMWKEYSLSVKLFYLFLVFLSGLMLLPAITGWISTWLHLSGIASYLLVFFGSKGLKRRSKGSWYSKRSMGASILGGWDKSLTLNIKSEQNEFSELRILSCSLFLSNLSILKI